MAKDRIDIADLTKSDIMTMSNESLANIAQNVLRLAQGDRKEAQIFYYKPAHEQARRMHKSHAMIIGIGGGNRCQGPGTRVQTGRGMLKIEDVVVGDRVPGRGRWPGVVTALYKSPAPVGTYRVETKRGYTMTGSGEHMNLVSPARNREWHNASDADWKQQEWRRLDALADCNADDLYIAMSTGGAFPAECSITGDDAYFLGLMVGDGFYASGRKAKNAMAYCTHVDDTELLAWMGKYLDSRGVAHNTRPKGTSKGVQVSWCNADLAQWMECVGVSRVLGPEKTVPESVWRGTREVVAAFIRGFADSDGCATQKPSVVFINRSTELMRGVHILLRQLKITASLRLEKPDVSAKRPNSIWRLEVTGTSLRRYQAEIGFLSARKQARLPVKKYSKKSQVQSRWDRIKSVSLVGEDYVYGLTISPQPHYRADGFIQHNSSKTESSLVELIALSTGALPYEIRDDIKDKFKGPRNVRVVCESLKTVLHPIMLPKLQWWKWQGIDQPGGKRGHWGWVPKMCLVDGSWEKSWSEKLNILTLVCRNPDDFEDVLGQSQIQFNSFDQDPSDFASGSFDDVLHDEPPPYYIWQENMARVIDVGGRVRLSMTWPDDPAIAVDWIYDEVYERGIAGPKKSPNVDWFDYDTRQNIHLDQTVIAAMSSEWSETTRGVRLEGKPVRFSNLVHPLFTEVTDWWCYSCKKQVNAVFHEGKSACPVCAGTDVAAYCHVKEFDNMPHFPVVRVIDPHPRKPHMVSYFMIDAADDVWQVAELLESGNVELLRDASDAIERALNMNVTMTLMDPNMGASPVSAMNRDVTWQSELAAVGIIAELADTSHVGRARLNEFLAPDPFTRAPRFHVHPRCLETISQFRRYVWDDYKKSMDRGQKQTPRDKYDDFPTNAKYLMNYEPSFQMLHRGAEVIKTGFARSRDRHGT